MSYLYTNKIGKMYLGGTEIAKAYLGSNLVYQNGGTPTPTIEPVFYDFLYFDGTAFVQTNYVLPENCSIRCTIGAETSKASQHVFGAYGANGGYTAIVYGGSTSSTRRQIVPYYDSSSYLSGNRYLAFSYNTFSLFLTPNRFGWGNSAYSITKGSLHPNGPLNLGSTGSSSSTQKFTGRFAILRVYGSDAAYVSNDSGFDNYTPIATFRPCTYDGEAGIWYIEGNAFFGNSATSGTLTASNY